jgi:phage-related protein
MFDGSTKAWCPSITQARKNTWRLAIAQFGDGYAQRALDGINAMQRSWDVQFEKESAVIADMNDYLEGLKAHAFPFQDPATGILYQVTCDEWQVDWQRINFDAAGNRKALYGVLTAQFVQAFGDTVSGSATATLLSLGGV